MTIMEEAFVWNSRKTDENPRQRASTFPSLKASSGRTCFHCKRSCRQVSAGSSRRCRWARRCARTRASTAGCHCRQWICPPCWAPWLGWSLSGFGSSPPAGGSCAGGYCGGRFQTAHSYKNTHQRQETNRKSYRAAWARPAGAVWRFGATSAWEQRKLSYQFLRTSVVIKAAMTMMRDTVIVIIWWTAKPAKDTHTQVCQKKRWVNHKEKWLSSAVPSCFSVLNNPSPHSTAE